MKDIAALYRKWTGRLAAAALLATLLAALPAAPAAAAQPAVVRIGVATAGGGDPITWGGSPGSVARANNWLEQAFAPLGIKVEWLFFKGAGPAVNEALSNKQIDFAYQGDLPAAVGRANGLDTKILLVSGARNNFYLLTPPNSSIHSIADLKGRTVALFRGTNGHLVAENVLAANQLRDRDLKIINLDTGSAQAAIVSNGVDAAFGGIEYFKLRDQGLVKVVYSTQGQDPAYTRQAALLVRTGFEQEYPQETQRVVDVFVRASRWASDEANRDALFKLWAKSGIPYESFKAEFQDQDLKARNSPLVDDFIRGRYQAVVTDALQQKLIRRNVSVNDWFDTRYLEQALKAQGLQAYWTRYDVKGAAERSATGAATGSAGDGTFGANAEITTGAAETTGASAQGADTAAARADTARAAVQ
jgi:sulfonate transport system substrate-binding protein